MCSQPRLGLEGIVTNRALEWPLISVHNEVVVQPILGLEGFVTFRAVEWFLIRVCYG